MLVVDDANLFADIHHQHKPIVLKRGDFYKLPFRKFREDIWMILGRKEGAMWAL